LGYLYSQEWLFFFWRTEMADVNSKAAIAAVFEARKTAPFDSVIAEAYQELIFGSALSVTTLIGRMIDDPDGPANFGEQLIVTLYRRHCASWTPHP
jgi:hypothetical protein